MKIKSNIEQEVQKIFESKIDFHRSQAQLPIKEKIKILIELQKIGKLANPERTKDKKIWEI
ncbi:MAG: hypothetical protein IPL53_09100 [Ignavibacteria bacterium]|nr:hypothetical protein [Ignavibacteria bacterium]